MTRIVNRLDHSGRRLDRTTSRQRRRRHPRGEWLEFVHVFGALVLVIGVLAAASDGQALISRLERMNGLEESGFAAALIVSLRGLGGIVAAFGDRLAALIAWFVNLRR